MGYQNNSRPEGNDPDELLCDAICDLTDIRGMQGMSQEAREALLFVQKTLRILREFQLASNE